MRNGKYLKKYGRESLKRVGCFGHSVQFLRPNLLINVVDCIVKLDGVAYFLVRRLVGLRRLDFEPSSSSGGPKKLLLQGGLASIIADGVAVAWKDFDGYFVFYSGDYC